MKKLTETWKQKKATSSQRSGKVAGPSQHTATTTGSVTSSGCRFLGRLPVTKIQQKTSLGNVKSVQHSAKGKGNQGTPTSPDLMSVPEMNMSLGSSFGDMDVDMMSAIDRMEQDHVAKASQLFRNVLRSPVSAGSPGVRQSPRLRAQRANRASKENRFPGVNVCHQSKRATPRRRSKDTAKTAAPVTPVLAVPVESPQYKSTPQQPSLACGSQHQDAEAEQQLVRTLFRLDTSSQAHSPDADKAGSPKLLCSDSVSTEASVIDTTNLETNVQEDHNKARDQTSRDKSTDKTADGELVTVQTIVISTSGDSPTPASNIQVTPGEDSLSLSSWGLPEVVLQRYTEAGITRMFDWQAKCLMTGNVLAGGNLVYSAPTSAGKTIVAELLILKRVLETKKKAIVILPFVSVSREKMFYLQYLFQDAGIKVGGFMGSHSPAGGLHGVDIAVCTIEKANSLVNRLLQENALDILGIVVVDELHMIGDSHRGYLLELLLTKINFVSKKFTDSGTKPQTSNSSANDPQKNAVQIIGMSATLPNLDMLANWLKADLYKTDFRPVPLTECVKIGSTLYDSQLKKLRDINPTLKFRGDDENIIPLCLETILDKCSVLIFCPSKNWCEKLAESIAREFYELLRNPQLLQQQGTGFVKASSLVQLPIDRQAVQDVVEQLRRTPIGLDPVLGRLVAHGVGYHHAGLTFDERDIVEGGFRQGVLKVLVATSTLSSGVNLPARRVIIRTPTFHGGIIDTLSYKQMVGRAGRKGVDIAGESILVCKQSERNKAVTLVKSELPPVRSCLINHQGEQLSSSMKRAILEIVVSGVASNPEEVSAYASCTMLAASLQVEAQQNSGNVIEACLKFLQDNEFVQLKNVTNNDGSTVEKFYPTQLGSAVLASALSPDEGLVVFAELQRARQCFVLENELHIIYQVTPVYAYDLGAGIDWYNFLCMWEKLTPGMKRVAELVGVQESYLARAIRGNVQARTARQAQQAAVHRRFYTCLVLHDLVHEMPLSDVCKKYNCNRGQLQSLQQSAATFAGMVTVFCHRLGWLNLELILGQFQSRLTFGVQRELCDLVRVSVLNGQRARVMFNGGYQTVAALANADPADLEHLLRNASPFQSKKRQDGESEWEVQQRQKARCIWLTGKKGVTEYEAALAIIAEAKALVEEDLGGVGVQWSTAQSETPRNSRKSPKHSNTLYTSPKSTQSESVVVVTPPGSRKLQTELVRKPKVMGDTREKQMKKPDEYCNVLSKTAQFSKSADGGVTPTDSKISHGATVKDTGVSDSKGGISKESLTDEVVESVTQDKKVTETKPSAKQEKNIGMIEDASSEGLLQRAVHSGRQSIPTTTSNSSSGMTSGRSEGARKPSPQSAANPNNSKRNCDGVVSLIVADVHISHSGRQQASNLPDTFASGHSSESSERTCKKTVGSKHDNVVHQDFEAVSVNTYSDSSVFCSGVSNDKSRLSNTDHADSSTGRLRPNFTKLLDKSCVGSVTKSNGRVKHSGKNTVSTDEKKNGEIHISKHSGRSKTVVSEPRETPIHKHSGKDRICEVTGPTEVQGNKHSGKDRICEVIGPTEVQGNKHSGKDRICEVTGPTEVQGNKHSGKDRICEVTGPTEVQGSKHYGKDRICEVTGPTEVQGSKHYGKDRICEVTRPTEVQGSKHYGKDRICEVTGPTEVQGSKHSGKDRICEVIRPTEVQGSKHFGKDRICEVTGATEVQGSKHSSCNQSSEVSIPKEMHSSKYSGRDRISEASAPIEILASKHSGKNQIFEAMELKENLVSKHSRTNSLCGISEGSLKGSESKSLGNGGSDLVYEPIQNRDLDTCETKSGKTKLTSPKLVCTDSPDLYTLPDDFGDSFVMDTQTVQLINQDFSNSDTDNVAAQSSTNDNSQENEADVNLDTAVYDDVDDEDREPKGVHQSKAVHNESTDVHASDAAVCGERVNVICNFPRSIQYQKYSGHKSLHANIRNVQEPSSAVYSVEDYPSAGICDQVALVQKQRTSVRKSVSLSVAASVPDLVRAPQAANDTSPQLYSEHLYSEQLYSDESFDCGQEENNQTAVQHSQGLGTKGNGERDANAEDSELNTSYSLQPASNFEPHGSYVDRTLFASESYCNLNITNTNTHTQLKVTNSLVLKRGGNASPCQTSTYQRMQADMEGIDFESSFSALASPDSVPPSTVKNKNPGNTEASVRHLASGSADASGMGDSLTMSMLEKVLVDDNTILCDKAVSVANVQQRPQSINLMATKAHTEESNSCTQRSSARRKRRSNETTPTSTNTPNKVSKTTPQNTSISPQNVSGGSDCVPPTPPDENASKVDSPRFQLSKTPSRASQGKQRGSKSAAQEKWRACLSTPNPSTRLRKAVDNISQKPKLQRNRLFSDVTPVSAVSDSVQLSCGVNLQKSGLQVKSWDENPGNVNRGATVATSKTHNTGCAVLAKDPLYGTGAKGSVDTPGKTSIFAVDKDDVFAAGDDASAAEAAVDEDEDETVWSLRMTCSQSSAIPSTQGTFTIIDVCAEQNLFSTFLTEWRSKGRFSLCIACEQKPPPPLTPGVGIGGRFLRVQPGAVAAPPRVSGLDVGESELVIVGLAVCWENRDSYYISLCDSQEEGDADDSLAPPPMDSRITVTDRLTGIRSVLDLCQGKQLSHPCVVTFDIKNQYKVLAQGCGVTLKGEFQDPKVACWLLDPGAKEKPLHRLVNNLLPSEVHLLEGLGGGFGAGSLGLTPRNPGSGRCRATVESVLNLHLMDQLLEGLRAQKLYKSFQTVEMPSVITLARMELNGMGFSEEECESQMSVMQAKLSAIEQEAYRLAGHPFSLTSTDDIVQVLYFDLRLPPNGDPSSVTSTKTLGPNRRRGMGVWKGGRGKGQLSTAKDALEKLKAFHPLPGLLLEWRRISSAVTKVVFPLQKEKVYCSRVDMYRIFGESSFHTATGRVTMSEPNLQNIPKDFEIQLPGVIGESPPSGPVAVRVMGVRPRGGKGSVYQRQTSRMTGHNTGTPFAVSMRHAFVPFKGGVLLAADYSQLELRMLAHLSGDERLMRILNADTDVFKLIASQWKGLPVKEVSAEQRQQAKQVCYGMLYGIGPKALAEQLAVEEEEAAVFIETFKSKYTGMRTFIRETINKCRKNGYVETLLHRKRYLPAITDTNPHARAHAERQAVNTTVQGSAADLVKTAMVRIEEALMSKFPDAVHTHRHSSSGKCGLSGNVGVAELCGAYLTLQLHDELIYEASEKNLKQIASLVKHHMEQAIRLSVKLPVKVKVGKSWGKLDDYEIA